MVACDRYAAQWRPDQPASWHTLAQGPRRPARQCERRRAVRHDARSSWHPSALAHRVPLLIRPLLHGAHTGPAHALHPAAAIDDDEISGDIRGLIRGEVSE